MLALRLMRFGLFGLLSLASHKFFNDFFVKSWIFQWFPWKTIDFSMISFKNYWLLGFLWKIIDFHMISFEKSLIFKWFLWKSMIVQWFLWKIIGCSMISLEIIDFSMIFYSCLHFVFNSGPNDPFFGPGGLSDGLNWMKLMLQTHFWCSWWPEIA